MSRDLLLVGVLYQKSRKPEILSKIFNFTCYKIQNYWHKFSIWRPNQQVPKVGKHIHSNLSVLTGRKLPHGIVQPLTKFYEILQEEISSD